MKSPMWWRYVNIVGVVLNALLMAWNAGLGNWGLFAVNCVCLTINLNGARRCHYE